MKNWIKRQIFKFKYLKEGVKIGNGVILDLNTKFEGGNVIGNHTQVTSSYIGYASYIGRRCVFQKTNRQVLLYW